MSEKRRGLGRGLGALIPTSSEGKRPVDVFFPSAPAEESPRDEADNRADPVDAAADANASTADVTPVVTLVADAPSGPSDVDVLTALSESDLAELDAMSNGTGAADAAGSNEGSSVDSPSSASEPEGSAPKSDAPGSDVSRETEPSVPRREDSSGDSPLDERREPQETQGVGDLRAAPGDP